MVNTKAYESPFVQFHDRQLSLQKVLTGMVDARATDFYMRVGEPIVYKVDDKVVRYDTEKLTDRHMRQVMAAFFSESDVDRFRRRREVDTVHAEDDVRYRVHLATGNHGVYGVIRRISQDIMGIESLGLPSKAIEPFKKLRSGLVLIAGATGQGKTMTAVSLLDHIAQTRPATLLTLEDPIEYIFQDYKGMFIQREVGLHLDSFGDGIRAALRENLDVIYVGEMRDTDTIEQGLKAAEMGHLVITTIHAEDTISALGRIVGSFTSSHHSRIHHTLSSGLSAVITQRLLPGKRSGLVLGAEVMYPNTAIRSVLRGGEFSKLAIYMGQSGSGVSYREHLQELFHGGKISQQVRDEEIAAYMQRIGGADV
jgi:pilus retraction protein PilT